MCCTFIGTTSNDTFQCLERLPTLQTLLENLCSKSTKNGHESVDFVCSFSVDLDTMEQKSVDLVVDLVKSIKIKS